MAEPEAFEEMLKGGHHNSLGRTEEVAALVVQEPSRFDELFACYRSDDELVRLRVSSAMKRIEPERRDLILRAFGNFVDQVGPLDQPSAQWTLAQLFGRMADDLDAAQRQAALDIMQRNLSNNKDWIVLNTTMETLTEWALENRENADASLSDWLLLHLKRLSTDKRKSVAARARKFLAKLA